MTNYLSQSQIKRLIHQKANKPKQPKQPKQPKYGNHKVVIDGKKVADSQHEYRRLKELHTQVRYNLIPSQKICGEKVRGTDYITDFVYWTKDDKFICEDAKGHKTADYVIKRKLMKFKNDLGEFRYNV